MVEFNKNLNKTIIIYKTVICVFFLFPEKITSFIIYTRIIGKMLQNTHIYICINIFYDKTIKSQHLRHALLICLRDTNIEETLNEVNNKIMLT